MMQERNKDDNIDEKQSKTNHETFQVHFYIF